MPAELFIMIFTPEGFQRATLSGICCPADKSRVVSRFISVRFRGTTGSQLFLFPVDTTANRSMPNLNVISPLNIGAVPYYPA